MSKITFENKKGKITIINRLSYPETINERIYNAIASGLFEGFLPVTIRQKRKETRIECVVQGLIPLTQYFNGIVTKKMFLDFVREIALLIKYCEKNLGNANNIDLQSDRIFIDFHAQKVKCIFWPIVNNQTGKPPYLFLKQLPFELNFNQYEDNGYLEVYKRFFSGINPFSINSFERMLLEISGLKYAPGQATPAGVLFGAPRADEKLEKNGVDPIKGTNIEYNPFSASSAQADTQKTERENKPESHSPICASCGTKNRRDSNYCIRCGTKLEKAAERGNTKVEDTFNHGAMVMRGGNIEMSEYRYGKPVKISPPTLVSLRTNESYFVDRPTFRIGTGKKYCNLVIDDNKFVSRNHADIITRGGRCYIVDRNSTNKTFVDGKAIMAEKEIEIFNGTQIRLANEVFIFTINKA